MIYLILIVGLVLRLISLNQSLWLDEAIGALAVRDLSIREIILKFLPIDNHPPLYYLVLKLWTSVFGYSEISLRLPSVIFGICTIILTFLIAERISKSKTWASLSALLLATSQFHIYYSQEARMYSLAAFLATLAVFSFLQIERINRSLKYWTIFSISVTLMLTSDYMPVFLLPIFPIYGLIEKKKKEWWIKLTISFLPIFIFGLFWLPIFNKQVIGGRWLIATVPTWLSVAGGSSIKQLILVWMKFSLGRITFTNKMFYYFITLIASVPFVVIFIKITKVFKKYLILLIWLTAPIISSFLLSGYIPFFIYFRLLFVIPAFYILIGLGIGEIKNHLVASLLTIVLIFINLTGYFYYITNPSQQRENWRGAVSYVESRLKPGVAVLFSYPEPFAPYRWYEKIPDSSIGVTDSIYANNAPTVIKTKNVLKDVKGVYYFEYLKDISDPNSIVLTTIIGDGFKEIQKVGNFNGVGYIYYFAR